MQGTRLPDTTWPDVLPEDFDLRNRTKGSFWKVHGGPNDGGFYVCAPEGSMGSIAKHYVIEHEDGMITVPLRHGDEANSIQISTTRDGREVDLWHGSVEHGVWVHI